MKTKVIQTLIIVAVIIAAFLAFYLRRPVEVKPEVVPGKQQVKALSAEKPTFVLSIDTKKPALFGILGEARGDDSSEEPINTAVLNQLLEVLKIRQVQAIFFSGNLVSGVDKQNDSDSFKPINDESLENDLKQFSQLYDSILGSDLPFYPALGDREILIPNSAETFIKHFKLQGATLLGGELLYTVSAGRAFFAVIATDELSPGRKTVEQTFSSGMLEWLDKVLKEGAKNHRYLFVIGYEPAFPSTSTFSKAHMPQRDAFWKLLIDNKVLAYFSSKEHLFDRSNRGGVWQIISGGGGAPLSQGGGSHPFFHCLLLNIPAETAEKNKEPTVQVIDNTGKIIDEFILDSENQPLYQMRISRN